MTSRLRYWSYSILLMMTCVPDASFAVVSLDDSIKGYVNSSLLYDSNFLRLSNAVNPLTAGGKSSTSEFVKQVSAGFDMDWAVSKQHFIVKGGVNQNWFQNYTTLDYTGWDTSAKWNWEASKELNGELGYSNVEALGAFNNLNQLIPNLANTQRYIANAGYLFHPKGLIKFDLARTSFNYDSSLREISDYVTDSGEVNLQYLNPNAANIGLRFFMASGRYPFRAFPNANNLDNAYNKILTAVTWAWLSGSELFRMDGFLGYNQQHYPHVSIRDFGSVTAGLNLHWQISVKTFLEVNLKREIIQANNINSSFVQLQGVQISPKWLATPKIEVMLPLNYYQQQYLGETGASGANPLQQVNTTGSVGLNVSYKPIETISLSALFNYEKRDSNYSEKSYESRSVAVNIQANF